MIILNIGFLFGDLGALASNQGIVIPSWEAGAVIGSIVQNPGVNLGRNLASFGRPSGCHWGFGWGPCLGVTWRRDFERSSQ